MKKTKEEKIKFFVSVKYYVEVRLVELEGPLEEECLKWKEFPAKSREEAEDIFNNIITT
jgi:hypothetical protein